MAAQDDDIILVFPAASSGMVHAWYDPYFLHHPAIETSECNTYFMTVSGTLLRVHRCVVLKETRTL
jgi:hypothetical protein